MAGAVLPNGWRVISRITPPSTGSCFSVGYLVENESGNSGFLKALDLSGAMRSTDMTRELKNLLVAFEFERDLLDKCKSHRFTRVVYAIEYNQAEVDPNDPMGTVPYLIFERADGDIRRAMDELAAFDLAWALRSLHGIAVGIRQLHSVGIAHQDLKPSNILTFQGVGVKLADLGRASTLSSRGPWDDYKLPGDPRYAPPEQLYGFSPVDWGQRRVAADLYHLGSMVHFLFADLSLTAALMQHLSCEHKVGGWKGTFEDLLPHLAHAFSLVLHEFSEKVPIDVRDDVVAAVRYLGDPDPRLRGHPVSRQAPGQQFTLDRFVSLFNQLALKIESKMAH